MKTTWLSLVLAAAQWNLLAAGKSAEDFVAHEWGTFTSVQGADGVLIPWNPLETTKLPGFVYNWSRPGLDRLPAGALNPLSKAAYVSLQRMETPVIYFYSDVERTLDVDVRFPQGLITEWYPQAQEIGPSTVPPGPVTTVLDQVTQQAGFQGRTPFETLFARKGVPESRIHWHSLRVLPARDHPDLIAQLPTDGDGQHYSAARETDAAFVRVESSGRGTPPEHEKFLFYRGLANFNTPLTVMLGGANEDRVSLTNTGGTELKHLFVLDVRKGEAQFVRVDRLAPGEFRTVEPPSGDKSGLRPLVEIANELSHELTGALTAEGLHEREAAAMVKTWRPSWFEEEGIRVIYTLPRTWTDSILPLSLDPAPRELVRVMVGRAEIIKPITQWELLKQIVRYAEGDADGRQQAIANVKALELGRFIQPALQTVLGRQPSQEFSRAAWDLLNAASRHDEVKPIALR